MNLQTPIPEAGVVFKKYASRLAKLGIFKLEDFLYHLPSRYEDYSLISKINQAQSGEVLTIKGEVIEIKNEYTRRSKFLQKAKIQDETGIINAIWFNQSYLTKILYKGVIVSLSGKISIFKQNLVMEAPEYEIISQKNAEPYTEQRRNETIHTGRLVPIYPETKGVSSKWLRRQISKLINEHTQIILEHIPDSIINRHDLISITKAIEQIHFPLSIDKANKARERLAFDELFLIQLASLERRKTWEKKLIGYPFFISDHKEKIEEFWSKLPFELTNAQKKVVKEIFVDLASTKPMNRLLQGDVGSGKTVVAAISMYLAYLNGFQSVLMAPTEILAQQHYQTITKLLTDFKVRVGLVTSSKKIIGIKNQELRIKKNHNSKFMIHDSIDILVGTHALLSDKLSLNKLGLVVIDEQQRFGVEQRAIIRKKGNNPHFLTMTATPIPRTIALTLYGDLDLSFLDEMPKGRKIIKTWLVPSEKRDKAYEWIKSQIFKLKSQIFIICPFIEESESMQTVKAAKKEFEKLKNEVFKEFRLGLLHGKLKSKEKDTVLQGFRNKDFDILVATPVVEVGIDIPNATIIFIEAAERFGLSQLHQLRGRVGRSDKQSYCLLFTESQSPQTKERLKALETMQNGAELAEFDLKLRGPGEIYGTMQHGKTFLKIASFSDFSLIQKTKTEAEKIFPNLSKYPLLKDTLKAITTKSISPD